MGLLSGNSCNIITLLPLGVDCTSINASTPQSSNGVVSLNVTGGTPPYNITWDNGGQGNLLTNLRPGSYTATIVDYYGDFTGTTTCVVEFDSFYLEQFENCSFSGTYVYYLADLVNPFSAGTVYELTTQTGCWTSSGTTLYTNQTYIGSYAVSSANYTGCTQCLPTPTPTPVYPNNLCFELTQGTSITQINFASGSTINGYPSWTSVTPSYVMYYSSGTTRWTISGWTSGGVPYNITPQIPPTGSWTLVGGMSYGSSLVVSSGICQTPPITIALEPTNPSCSTTSNGSVVIMATGGLTPYTYSLDGVNYQVSNVFLNLGSGAYTAYVKDSSNTVSSQSFTLTAQQIFQNYNVNLVITPGQVINVGTSSTRTSNWTLTVSPTPLPAGVTVNMNLIFNVLSTGYTSTLAPTINNTIITNTNPNATISLTSTSPTIGTSAIRPRCDGGIITTSAYTKTYAVQLSTNGFASGTITQLVNTPCSNETGCELRGYLKDSVSVQNIIITPATCRTISTNVTPQQVTTQKIGLIC
jgi:hypothetical protein